MRKYLLFILLLLPLLSMAQTIVKIPFMQPQEFSVSPQTVYKSVEDLPLEIGLEVQINGGSGVYSFSWSFNGIQIGTTPTVTAREEGSYVLTVEDGNGCASSVSYLIGGNGLSNNDIDSSIHLYPNPSKGEFALINKELLPVSSIDILQANGSLMQSIRSTAPNKEISFNLSGYPSGYYLIVSHIANRKISKILILE